MSLFETCSDEQFLSLRNDVFLCDMGLHSRANGHQVRNSQVADEEIAPWRRRFLACEASSRNERNSDARSHQSVHVDNNLHGGSDHSNQEGEVDARVLVILYSSADRRFRKWEDVVLDSFACNYEDHPVTRRHDVTSVELAASHHELAVDPLRWFADFAMGKHWHSLDASFKQLQGLIQIWFIAGTYDQLNLRGVAAMEELARQIWSCVDA